MLLPIIIKQYERGVLFTLGKYKRIIQPGLSVMLWPIQHIVRIDLRQQTIDLPPQTVMTKDQVVLNIDGVVFYHVVSPEKVILNVKNIQKQITDKASSELKEIIGDKTMKESLGQREIIAKELIKRLLESIQDRTHDKSWGIVISSIQINNIKLPDELVRAMSKQAEAEREREARVTKALGECEASKKFAEASKVYAGNPTALKLRELQTYQEIGTEHNSLMIVIPSSMATADGRFLLPLGQELMRKGK